MFKLMGKKIFTILLSFLYLNLKFYTTPKLPKTSTKRQSSIYIPLPNSELFLSFEHFIR